MKRHLRKVIFLPADNTVLTDSEFIGTKLIEVTRNDFYDLPLWKRILSLILPKIGKEVIPDPNHEVNYQGSVWKAIEDFKQFGFEVMLYPENESSLNPEEVKSGLQLLIDKNLAVGMIQGNTMTDFLNAVDDFNINFHNSILVSKEPEIIEPFLDYYMPSNRYDGFKKFPDKPFCFGIVYWNSSNSKIDKNLCFTGREKIPYELARLIYPGNLVYSSGDFPFMTDRIVYIEDTYNGPINSFITENIGLIKEKAKAKGCSFAYFNRQSDEAQIREFFEEYLDYNYPDCQAGFIPDFLSFQQQLPSGLWSSLLLDLLNLPAFNTPALIRSRASIAGAGLNEYSIFTLDSEKDIQMQFEGYLENIQPAGDMSHLRFSLAKNANETADDKFNDEASKLTEDIIQKIEYLKANGMHSLLAEIALRMYNDTYQIAFKPTEKAGSRFELMSDVNPVISRLRIEWVSKYDFQITLPDYGNKIVEMPRLPKALYYFFLQHPEGVMLNSLADYKGELLSIYERISNKGDKDEIVRNINRLVDPLDNSVNVNCSRIKNAFVKLMSDRMAKHYYITGWRGEPKKVGLLPEQIEIIHMF
jgi:hypothetical protein